MKLENTVIVITGGASGMGYETARYLAAKGAKIAIFDVDENGARLAADEIKGLAVKCNVVDEDEVVAGFNRVAAELGAPRVCINCAGIAPAKRIVGKDGTMPLADFKKVIDINLVGTFNVLRLAATVMSQLPVEEEERGVIINTASIAAFEGQIGQTAYSASKGAICALTLPAARELAQNQIRVMTIAPGMVQTPILEGLPEAVQTKLASNIVFPLRFGKPVEYAMLAAHIIENPYLNGEVIRLDAGLRMPAK